MSHVSSHPTHSGFFRAQEDALHTRADAGDPVFVVAAPCMFFQQAPKVIHLRPLIATGSFSWHAVEGDVDQIQQLRKVPAYVPSFGPIGIRAPFLSITLTIRDIVHRGSTSQVEVVDDRRVIGDEYIGD